MTPDRPTTDGQQALWLLRAQLLLSGCLIVGGTILSIARTGTLPDHTQDLRHVLSGLAAGDAPSWVTAGFLLLILTPVQRLLSSAAVFVRERDWHYVWATGLVLLIIGSGLLIGRH